MTIVVSEWVIKFNGLSWTADSMTIAGISVTTNGDEVNSQHKACNKIRVIISMPYDLLSILYIYISRHIVNDVKHVTTWYRIIDN